MPMDSSDPVVDHDAGWGQIDCFLSADEVEQVLAVCGELLSAPPEQRRPRDKPVAGTVHLVELDARSPFIEELVQRPALVAAVTAVLGPDVRRDVVELRSPEPGFGAQQLHADDVAKLGDGPATVATAIIALTDFGEHNGSTRLVPGSHLRPDLQRQSGALASHRDEIHLTGSEGTAFVFSGHVLHSGTTNRSERARPALHVVWRA